MNKNKAMANRVEQFMVVVDNKKVFFYKTKSGYHYMIKGNQMATRISGDDYESYKHSDR